MSNNAVGAVYHTIIDEVINSSRVDFEENGVEESVLEELRLGWQLKLTKLDVARFPWDPKPEQPTTTAPAAAAAAAPPVPQAANHSQAHFSPQIPLPGAGVPATSAPNSINTEQIDFIKQEPGTQVKAEAGAQPPAAAAYQGYNGMDNKNSIAANRAAQHLEAQYGNRAAGSINAIQDRMGQQSQTQSPTTPQIPHQTPVHPPIPPYTQSQQPAQAQGYPQQNGQPNGQTDGPGDDEDDFEGVLLRQNVSGGVEELGRVEIDRLLHEQIAAKAKSMEGGGLMLPLKEATRHRSGVGSNSRGKGIAQHDGGDDDDEDDPDDEDLINSDLDDPEEENEDEEVDDEGLGHIMLCMYDKVQRVKNKWKCTLKDGVLTVNGKEYVFHKATGEYEW